MYDLKVWDEVMVEYQWDIKNTQPWHIGSIQGDRVEVGLYHPKGMVIGTSKETVYPILTMTWVEQWQIQKRITRDIKNLLEQQQQSEAK